MFRIYLVTSGSGKDYTIGHVENLKEEGTALINKLDADWLKWEELGHPTRLAETPFKPREFVAIQHYEGCDIYAKDLTTGQMYDFNDKEEWEPWPAT